MTTHDTMADLSALNPILVLPLASPASAHFTVTSLKSSPLWNCDLLKPARGRSASYFTTPDNGSIGQNDPCAEALICDGRRKLSELLTHNPTPLHAKPSALLSPIDLLSPRAFLGISSETPLTSPLRHTMPAHGHPHNHSRPTTSGHKSKTPRSSFRIRQRTPKSTLSRSLRMAAPAPRIPLASVLQSWAAHDAQATPYSGDVMEVDGEEWRSYGWDRAPETSPAQPRSRGLGLLLGFSPPTFARTRASHSHSHSREQREAEGESQSHIHDSAARTKFSRRLRRLAPAPLQLASSTSHRAAPYVSSQALSPHAQCTSTPVTFYDVPMDNSGAQNIDPTPAPASEDIPSLNLSPSLDNSQRSPRNLITNAFSGMAARFRTRTKSTSSPTSHDFPMNSRMSIDHHNMIPKCTNPDMTDTNANSNQSPCTPTHPTHVDADPSVSYLDLMSWRRSVSRALDTPLSPGFAAEYTPKSIPVPVPVLVPAAHNLPPTPRHRPQPAQTQNPTTPGAPPQVRRQWFVPLPQSPVRDENQWDWDGDAGARADLRLDLDAEDLAQRAEKCAEAISRASFSLRSCSLLKDPDALAALCERLRAAFGAIRRALDGTPTDFLVNGSRATADARRNWYTKHCHLISSLDRNLNHFYLLAHHIEERPPRIHRLASIVEKLETYEVKFTDLAHRISASHDRLRVLDLRAAHYREGMQREGRAQRNAIREELRRVRGTIRAVRQRSMRHIDAVLHEADGEEGRGRQRRKWEIG